MKLFKKLGLFAVTGAMALGIGLSLSTASISETKAAIAWVKVSNLASITSGSKYLFTATYNDVEYYMDASGAAVTTSSGYVAGLKSQLSTESETETYAITAVTGGYEISDNGYKVYTTNTNDGLRSATTIPSGASGVWTFAENGDGTFTMSSPDNANPSVIRKLALYSNVDWRCYSSTSGIQKIVLYKSEVVPDVLPTSVSVSLSLSSIEVGENSLGTATVLPEGATNKQVIWTSSNELVATVSSTGVVTGVGPGSSDITATSVAVGTLFDTKSISVTGMAPSVYDKTLTATKFGYGSSYITGNYLVEGVVYYTENVMKQSLKNNSLQFRADLGFMYNTSAFSANIKTITVDLEATNIDAEYTLTVGTSNNPSTIVTGSTTNNLTVYDVSSVGNFKFFKLLNNGSDTLYADSIVVEMVNADVEVARTYASSFLSTLDAECAVLNVSNSTWSTLSDSYSALSAAAKVAYTGEAATVVVTDIQKALERYVYIVNKYGYTNFMGITIPGASSTSLDLSRSNSVSTIVLIAVAGFTAIGGMFFLKRKREE